MTPQPQLLVVPLHGREVEVAAAALEAELARDGAIGSLALVEALVRHAPPVAALGRLSRALRELHGTIGLATVLAIVRLRGLETAPALRSVQAAGPLGVAARVAALLLEGGLAPALADDALLLRAPLVLTAISAPPTDAHALVDALLAGIDRLQPTLGATAYRALLGDVAEALFRFLQHGVDLSMQRDALVDRLSAELPGTPDLVAARGMTWLLGALAPNDDAARSAIERANDRFRDADFHRDCAAILDGAWPP